MSRVPCGRSDVGPDAASGVGPGCGPDAGPIVWRDAHQSATVTSTVTRWEWRTFGDRFGQVSDQLEALPSRGEEQSEELYLLSPSGDNVKVRGAVLDIKVLRELDGVGLQRWEPVVKAP